jgi:hypothetical protein
VGHYCAKEQIMFQDNPWGGLATSGYKPDMEYKYLFLYFLLHNANQI